MKLTFLCLNEELMFQEALANQSNLLDVSLFVRGVDEYIIQVHEDVLVEHVMKNIIN